MCSIVVCSVMYSNRRGTSETPTPASSQRCTCLSSTSLGAVEKATTTCSIPCSSIVCSRSQLAPRIGRVESGSARGSLSRKPTGRSPNSGCSMRRFATRCPIFPAPMIRVGLAASPPRRVSTGTTGGPGAPLRDTRRRRSTDGSIAPDTSSVRPSRTRRERMAAMASTVAVTIPAQIVEDLQPNTPVVEAALVEQRRA